MSFYLHGKTFETFEQLIDFAEKWPEQPADLVNFKQFLGQRYVEARMNIKFNPRLTNRMLFKLLRMNTDWVEDNQSEGDKEEI